jgi:hypothetical protein
MSKQASLNLGDMVDKRRIDLSEEEVKDFMKDIPLVDTTDPNEPNEEGKSLKDTVRSSEPKKILADLGKLKQQQDATDSQGIVSKIFECCKNWLVKLWCHFTCTESPNHDYYEDTIISETSGNNDTNNND